MKHLLLGLPLFLASTHSIAQQSISYNELSFNNVAAAINNNGTFFNEYGNQSSGYEIPKNSGKNAIYFMNLVAMGLDVNGNLRGALSNYESSDFFAGPVANDYDNSSYVSRFSQSLWVIDQVTINDHIAHWNDLGYVVPSSIAAWPGNGNTANGESMILAPFEDLDGDLLYEPALGEYPIIRGDRAILSILNDQANVHPSGSEPIGLELHLLFYQYASDDQTINNTTFIHARCYNRSSQLITNFSVGSTIDFDLGNPFDDYFGTAPASNLAYVYNGDMNDENFNGNSGYGEYPPAVGVVALNTGLTSYVPITSNNPNTTSAAAYYNMLLGKDYTGMPFYDNNGQQTTFLYNEAGINGWNQYTEGLPSGDVRTIAGYGTGMPNNTLHPNTSFCLDLAIVYAPNTTNELFGGVTNLIAVADSVQTFYNAQNYACLSTLSLDQQEKIAVQLFPNPTAGVVTLQGAENMSFEVHSTDGKLILNEPNGASFIDLGHVQAGIYTITFSNGTTALICKQ